MHPAVSMLLSTADDADLRRVVRQVGGVERAQNVLLDEARTLQRCADITMLTAVLTVLDKVENLARSTTG
jgi:hypothetical protein